MITKSKHNTHVLIEANSINEILYDCCKAVMEYGQDTVARGLTFRELHPATIILHNPTHRHLLFPYRMNNPFAQMAETFWVLAGRNDADWLSRYLPRALQFSDDPPEAEKPVWRGGYGPRLRKYGTSGIDQIKYVYDALKKDQGTRQAVINIWDADEEATIFYEGGTKDYCCNDLLQFMIRGGKLDLTVYVRSNDVIWGMCFTGETKIKLLNGTSVPIKNLVGEEDFWVYSCLPNGRIVPGHAHSCRKTGKKKIVKVTLDNGGIIRCTADHKFMLRDGTYKEARSLSKDDSLMPLYTEMRNGYEWVEHNTKLTGQGGRETVDSHRVVSIEEDGYEDIYDFTVDEHHNFALDAGIFVHNSGVNLMEWTVLHEIMAQMLGVKVGTYYQHIGSLHIYNWHFNRARAIYACKQHGLDKGSKNFDMYALPRRLNTYQFLNDESPPTLHTLSTLLSNFFNLDDFMRERRYNNVDHIIHRLNCTTRTSQVDHRKYQIGQFFAAIVIYNMYLNKDRPADIEKVVSESILNSALTTPHTDIDNILANWLYRKFRLSNQENAEGDSDQIFSMVGNSLTDTMRTECHKPVCMVPDKTCDHYVGSKK